MLALSYAAFRQNIEIAYKLIKKGAKVDMAIDELKELASKNLPYLDDPANKKAYDKANLAVKMLESGVEKLMNAKREEIEKENNAFQAVVRNYQKASVKPQLPEDAHKFKVQAEFAVGKKDFEGAAARYKEALDAAPWWPEGHFNRALILGELFRYHDAIREMKRYMTLVPDAPNARAAQDKIYQWEGELK